MSTTAGGLRRLAVLLCATSLAAGTAPPEPPLYEDVAPAAGLVFRHVNGRTGEFYFPEMTGQGGALFDYDGDGDLDAYLVQGGSLAASAAPVAGPPGGRLFRNELHLAADGTTRLRFVDVTESSGLLTAGYGMGVAVGDTDGDGWPDLYLTNYGENELWRNAADGTFENVTERSGTGDPLWGTSASFFDLEGDGDLDLYVANYVAFDVRANPRCFATSSRRDYCGPSGFPGQPDRLYRNLGAGRFEEVGARLLRDTEPLPALGVLAGDFTGDGRVDLYVANDGEPNRLWVQHSDHTFTDEALLAGVAVNRDGREEASMGVDAADFDGDGDEDLFVTHLSGETHTLYVNEGGGLFVDRTGELGLGSASLPFTGFGTGWVDADRDGRLDLVVLNGAVRIQEELAAAGDPYPLGQGNQLYLQREGRFVDATARAGAAFRLQEVSRGAAFGDVDNDGAVDVLQLNSNAPARLLRNVAPGNGFWVGLSPDLADGAVRLTVRGPGLRESRRSHTDGSYGSASDRRLVIDLPGVSSAWMRIDRPGRRSQRWPLAEVPAYLVAHPGSSREASE